MKQEVKKLRIVSEKFLLNGELIDFKDFEEQYPEKFDDFLNRCAKLSALLRTGKEHSIVERRRRDLRGSDSDVGVNNN